MSWTYIVLIICCLTAVFAIWKEYNRANRSHLILRIVASLLAVTALACIALPINYSKDVIFQGDDGAILLTAGFEPDSLSNKNNKLFTTDREIEKKYPKAKLVRLDELKNDSPVITKLHILGYGLTETELSQLDHLPVVFHPASRHQGITDIDWNSKLRPGETLRVQGKYKNDGLKPVELILAGLNTRLDTITIPIKSYSDFELNTVPKNEGRAVYHLLAVAGKDTLADENLPVEIDPIKTLKILILSASPDFETKFLKNWLSENGFLVAVRSAISKDKFSTEYVNMQPLKLDHLNDGLLAKFDLVIGDLSVLRSESALLKQQVTQNGLGIIIRADSSFKTASWLQNDFPVERSLSKDPAPVSLSIKDKKDKSGGLKVGPAYISFQPGTQPLVNYAPNYILANSSLAGAGRLVFTTVNNTFNWVLSGNKNDYAAFWSLLISKAVRKAPAKENWLITQLPTINEPLNLKLATSFNPGQIGIENVTIAPAQNPGILFEWDNTYWPEASGWHSISQANGKQAWCYIYKKSKWQGVRASEKITATSYYAETNKASTFIAQQIHQKVQIAVPKIYFYMLLLVACVFLWVEGKLTN